MYKIKRTNKKTGSIRHIRMEEDWRKTLLLDSLEEAEEIRDDCSLQRCDPPHWLRGNSCASPERFISPNDADYDEEYLEWAENYGKLNPNETWEIIEVKE